MVFGLCRSGDRSEGSPVKAALGGDEFVFSLAVCRRASFRAASLASARCCEKALAARLVAEQRQLTLRNIVKGIVHVEQFAGLLRMASTTLDGSGRCR